MVKRASKRRRLHQLQYHQLLLLNEKLIMRALLVANITKRVLVEDRANDAFEMGQKINANLLLARRE
jgi:hypothetical protein